MVIDPGHRVRDPKRKEQNSEFWRTGAGASLERMPGGVLVGASRKQFLVRETPLRKRASPPSAAVTARSARRSTIVRVHDMKAMSGVEVADEILRRSATRHE